jgi:nascent polypeptide-associated complex subunit alpha
MRIDQRQIERAMKRMGMQAVPIDAEEVVIKTREKEIIISSPQVTRVNVMGQDTFQIMGNVEEREKERFNESDVKMVMDKTGSSREESKKALMAEGDIASAILKLKKK